MTAPTAAPPFSLGVASFDPLRERVLLWTRLDEPAPCRWEVARDAAFAQVIASGDVDADPGTGVVSIDADGLPPGTELWYRFTSAGASSPVGRTRTLADGGAERMRIGATCCARYGQSDFTVYGALARHEVDLVVHLGDYIYEDTKVDSGDRKPDPPHDCVTLDDYRTRHAQARRDPDLQALHARHPMVVVWDDHDFADNAWRGGAKSHDEDDQGPWSQRRAAAMQAHQEFLPKRLHDPADLSTPWRHLDAGDLVRVVALEQRAHRDVQAGLEGAMPAEHPDRTMLGRDQAAWALEALADRGPRWVVALSGTVMSELVIEAPDVLDGMLPEKYAIVQGKAANTDQWDGYLVERSKLADAMASRGGSIVLSGDIHSAWAIEGPHTTAGAAAAVELVCPPAATTPVGQLLPPGVGAGMGPAIEAKVPHVRWVDVDHHGYLTLDITRDAVDAAWWWVEPGQVSEPERGRRWRVPRQGAPRLVDPEPEVRDDQSVHPRRRPGRVAKAAAVVTAVAFVVGVLARRRR